MSEVASNQNTMRIWNTVKSLCCKSWPLLWLFKNSFNRNSSAVPPCHILHFPMTHDRRSEMAVKGPCGAFTNGKRIRVISFTPKLYCRWRLWGVILLCLKNTSGTWKNTANVNFWLTQIWPSRHRLVYTVETFHLFINCWRMYLYIATVSLDEHIAIKTTCYWITFKNRKHTRELITLDHIMPVQLKCRTTHHTH